MKDRREKAALTMSITMDRCSTDDHGHHLANLRRSEVSSTLRPPWEEVKTEKCLARRSIVFCLNGPPSST